MLSRPPTSVFIWLVPITLVLQASRTGAQTTWFVDDDGPGEPAAGNLGFNQTHELFFRFRDFRGSYPIHCHNVLHEDHAMMMLFDVQDEGDTNSRP